VSSLTVGQLWTTIIGFTVLYGALAVVEVMLMVRFIRRGPYPEENGRPEAEPPRGAGEPALLPAE
jgi:cytochrome d ubiquinol oxidase subunit I